MEDMVPDLLRRIKKEYEKIMEGVKDSLEEVIKSGNYDNAYSYAQDTAAALVKAFKDNLSAEIFPEGRMYYNIANRIIPDMCQTAYFDTVEAAAGVQTVVNEAAGLGLKTQIPKFNTDRTRGLVDKISDEENFENVKWLLDKPVMENITQSAVDDTIKANAEFQYRSGVGAKIIRTMTANCCSWCKGLEGSYSYPDVPDEVYHRHENCRCLVKYIPIKGGKMQDVWSKRWDYTASEQTKDDISFMEAFEKKKRIAKANGEHCIDATEKWERNKLPVKSIKNNDRFVIKDGVRYDVDGVWVKFDPTAREQEVAKLFVEKYGGHIALNPKINDPPGIRMADYTYNGKFLDLKGIDGSSHSAIKRNAHKAKGQSRDFIFDISKSEISEEEARRQITSDLFRSTDTTFVDTAFLLKGKTFLGVFERI